MISSSEVGGCCRVQVAWLSSDRPPLTLRCPRGHHPSRPSGTLPVFRPSIPSVLTDSANLQNFRPYHRRSSTHTVGVWELARLFSPPRCCRYLQERRQLGRAEFLAGTRPKNFSIGSPFSSRTMQIVLDRSWLRTKNLQGIPVCETMP